MLTKHYPNKAISADYSSYSCVGQYGKDKDFYYVIEHKEKYRDKYNDVLLEMKEHKLVASKWLKEFELYLLVKETFPDCIFQYRDHWLGMQSLDIYIPSKSIAIEYQGEQHYEPIDFFGGEDGYKTTLERDKRKLLLCEKAGISLIYWKYDEPLSKQLLTQKIDKIKG